MNRIAHPLLVLAVGALLVLAALVVGFTLSLALDHALDLYFPLAAAGADPVVFLASVALVKLDTPLQRGDTTIAVVQLRKPRAGELRGVSITALLQMDVAALEAVLPRITSPILTKADVAQLDPADLLQLGTEVSGFLLPKAVKEAASLTE